MKKDYTIYVIDKDGDPVSVELIVNVDENNRMYFTIDPTVVLNGTIKLNKYRL